MDGFKDSTRTMYSMGGSAYAKGGSAKGGSKDMAQDKATASTAVHKHERALHKGAPMTKLAKGGSVLDFLHEAGVARGAFGALRDVKSSALGTGIGPNNLSGVLGNALAAKVARTGLGNALAAKVAGTGLASGLRRAGARIVAGDSATMGAGGRSRMPSAGDAMESGNRMSAMENREAIMLEREAMANQMRARQAMAKKRAAMRPSVGAAVESGNRMSAMEAAEARFMDKNMAMGGGVKKAMHGGAVKKAMGGAVKKAMGKKDC